MVINIYIFMNHKYVIFPKISKTRNVGCNGMGMNCQRIQIDPNKPVTSRNYDYAVQPIDDNGEFELVGAQDLSFNEENNRRLSKFYPVDKRERFRTVLAYIIYLILGRKLTKILLGCGRV